MFKGALQRYHHFLLAVITVLTVTNMYIKWLIKQPEQEQKKSQPLILTTTLTLESNQSTPDPPDTNTNCWHRLYEGNLRSKGPFDLSRTTMCAFSPQHPQEDEPLWKRNYTILLIGLHVGPASDGKVNVPAAGYEFISMQKRDYQYSARILKRLTQQYFPSVVAALQKEVWMAYKDHPNIQKADAIQCGFDTWHCLIFASFNKKLILNSAYRLVFVLMSTTLMVLVSCEKKESVVFQPVEQIFNSISSWILTTTIDFSPYQSSLLNVNKYTQKVKDSIKDYARTFHTEDPRYKHIIGLTLTDLDSVMKEITDTQIKASNLINHIHTPRHKRSLLPLGGFFKFLFGSADNKDMDNIKREIKTLYDNQVNQGKVFNEVISITNVSRGLINENIIKINQIIDTVTFLNNTIENINDRIKDLYVSRRFNLLHTESQIHHLRVRTLVRQIHLDIDLIKDYLNVYSTGKLSASIFDPLHLKQELLKIQKLLPAKLALPVNPAENIWHYYKFLTATPITHQNTFILVIKIPLLDLDSQMNLYKIHNLPIFHSDIGKSLQYQLEGYNLAVTKDNKYASLLSDTEFLTCTLAAGHFCSLNTGLYHVETSKWCVTALFFKNNFLINENCNLVVDNITGPQAIYLDQGHWAISVAEPTHMEIKCEDHSHVETLQPPITLIDLQPACSAFSSNLKLPPYFKQYSQGLPLALKTANIHIPNLSPLEFRIWQQFGICNFTKPALDNLKKLKPSPSIPVQILKAKIQNLGKLIDTDSNVEPWIYYVGGGSGSGLLLLIVIVFVVYWYCKSSKCKDSRSPTCVTYTAPVNQNMATSRVNGISADQYSALGRETVGLQGPVGTQSWDDRSVNQYAFASALLDQLEENGADVSSHRKRLGIRQDSGNLRIGYQPSISLQEV